ncbi:MAG: VPLPA-CTERM sorting domain-containing protein [Thiogranum sp.]
MRLKKLSLGVAVSAALAGVAGAAQATIWTTPIPGGEILFNDWGYTGPNGRTAVDFDPINGFNGATQIQHVITQESDGVTPDAPQDIWLDFANPSTSDPTYTDAFMDTMTNFYGWGYTSPAGSTFNNMQIDADGDYYIAREDMTFNYYGTIDYTNMALDSEGDPTPDGDPTADGIYATDIGFQPYALSDAKGWCGSVLTSNPASLEAMAGQVTFDFGFEAFFPWSNPAQTPGTGSIQIVKDFEMRSYGTIDVIGGSSNRHFTADAVVNNTDPGVSPVTGAGMVSVPVLNLDGTPALDSNGNPRYMDVEEKAVGAGGVDANSYNEVSFMGGGIVPQFVWILMKPGTAGALTDSADNILAVLDEDENGNPIIPIDPATGLPMEGDLVEHQNSFAGYTFLLRADGVRIIDGLDFSLYTDTSNVPTGALVGVADLSAVPVPAAVWLFGSGLIGLLGVARRRRA